MAVTDGRCDGQRHAPGHLEIALPLKRPSAVGPVRRSSIWQVGTALENVGHSYCLSVRSTPSNCWIAFLQSAHWSAGMFPRIGSPSEHGIEPTMSTLAFSGVPFQFCPSGVACPCRGRQGVRHSLNPGLFDCLVNDVLRAFAVGIAHSDSHACAA